MKELDGSIIDGLLENLGTAEKRRLHSENIRTGSTINGCQTARELSDIIDEAVLCILREMDLPDDVTIIGVGATGRQEATPGSDLDIIGYVPQTDRFEQEFAEPYRKNMWRVLGALELKGEPTVWVPGDFMKSDLVTIASMNLDARVLHGGTILTPEKIQKKVRAVCEPFFIASRHEEVLQNFHYGNAKENEFKVDFDIKEGRGGLRHLQHILWFIAAIEGTSLQSMYSAVQKEDPEVYDALDLMLHIRSWIHLKKVGTDDKKIDLLNGIFWPELKVQFGEDIIEKIQTARRAIIRYERTRILGEKKKGIKIGDGTKYGLLGLEIDNKSWLQKEDLVIQLLVNAQKTGLQISPLVFSSLEKEARKSMTRPNEKYAQLLQEEGDFSETIRRMRSLGIIDQVFPGFSVLENQTFHQKHRHAHINRIGRVMERLENLERIIVGDLKDIHDTLTPEQQAGIRIALTCKDIPEFSKGSLDKYIGTLRHIHPSIGKGIEVAGYLMEKHEILFNCARYDQCNDKDELKSIAGDIGTLDNLDALLVYTCAILDYGKIEYHHKSLWDKTFELYYALKKEMEPDTPEKQRKNNMMIMMRRERLSPEQDAILDTAHETFLRSRYFSASAPLEKTMRYLEKAHDTGEPQIKISENQEGTLRIIVSCKYTTEVDAIITGTCFQNNINIDDGETHTFKTEEPLAVLFLEASFNIPRTFGEREDTIHELEEALQKNLKEGKIPAIDHHAILEKSKPTYILEKTKKTGNYKFIIKAGNDTPGFLSALTKLIAEAGVDSLSKTIYTYPRRNGYSPHVEDIFILGPQNIDQLKKLLGIE